MEKIYYEKFIRDLKKGIIFENYGVLTFINEGFYADVFCDNNGEVLRFSPSKEDYIINEEIKNSESEIFPKIYENRILEEFDIPVNLTVRENINDIEFDHKSFCELFEHIIFNFRKTKNSLLENYKKEFGNEHQNSSDDYIIYNTLICLIQDDKKIMKIFNEWVFDIFCQKCKTQKDFKDTIKFHKKNIKYSLSEFRASYLDFIQKVYNYLGYIPGDISYDNLGLRDNNIVFRDFYSLKLNVLKNEYKILKNI